MWLVVSFCEVESKYHNHSGSQYVRYNTTLASRSKCTCVCDRVVHSFPLYPPPPCSFFAHPLPALFIFPNPRKKETGGGLNKQPQVSPAPRQDTQQQQQQPPPPSGSGVSRRNSKPSAGAGGLEDKYSHQLSQLVSMGFTNKAYNLAALDRARGDLNAALEGVCVCC